VYFARGPQPLPIWSGSHVAAVASKTHPGVLEYMSIIEQSTHTYRGNGIFLATLATVATGTA